MARYRRFDGNPAEAAIGLSWTLSRDLACWVATQYRGVGDVPGARPFVLEAELLPSEIITYHNGRREQEVIVDLGKVDPRRIFIEESNTTVAELHTDSAAAPHFVARWRAVGERRAARMRRHDLQKLRKSQQTD